MYLHGWLLPVQYASPVKPPCGLKAGDYSKIGRLLLLLPERKEEIAMPYQNRLFNFYLLNIFSDQNTSGFVNNPPVSSRGQGSIF